MVQVTANGSSAGTGPVNGVTNPTGLAFDRSRGSLHSGRQGQYHHGRSPQTVTTPCTVGLRQHKFSAASALAVSAGAQSFVLADIGSATNNALVYLNGNASTLNFGNVNLFNTSAPLTATAYNIGNLNLDLKSPYYSQSGLLSFEFPVQGNSTCKNGLLLAPSTSCTINVQFTPYFFARKAVTSL